MPKSRNSPALFELLGGRRQDSREAVVPRQPQWLNAGGGSRVDVLADSFRVEGTHPRIARDEEAEARLRASPLFELDGPQLRISLTSKTGAIALFAAGVVLLGVYAGGRQMGKSAALAQLGGVQPEEAALSELDSVRNSAPSSQAISDLLVAAPGSNFTGRTGESLSGNRQPASPSSKSAGSWTRGLTYIVAQGFSPGQLEDARKAQQYLEKHGVNATPVTMKSGDVLLIANHGYNWDEPTQKKASDELKDRIRAIGEKYFKSGGRYRLEGYPKTLTGDSWQL
jgi:hypothetical protein